MALLRAHGWAQAASHGNLVLRLYGQARGRAAEYWGETHLDSDRWVQTMGVPQRATAWYEQQSPRARALIDAFAAGFNDYAREHPEAVDDDLEQALPVTGADVLAHLQRVVHFTFVSGPQVVRAAERWLRTSASAFEAAAPVAPLERVSSAAVGRHATLPQGAGSNAWAVAPRRSATGNALLLANPHLPWSDLFVWFEVQLVAPGLDVYGAALVGMPSIGIGFNDRLGWTHTVNTYDGADLYGLELEAEGYRWDNEVLPFDVEERLLAVRQEDGTRRHERLVIRRSRHGPVIAADGDRAVALRVAGLEQPHLLDQWWSMARARDLGEFEAALQQLQLPMFTVMYADRDGRILHLFNGLVPRRPGGDWRRWSGVVPGDTPATLWSEFHAYEDLPRVVDPDSGWLQNANDPPWTTTDGEPLDADDYPDYLAPRRPGGDGLSMLRPQRSAQLLREAGLLDLDEMVERKHSTRMTLADRLLDDLLAAASASDEVGIAEAAAALGAWDRATDADSRGAVLFAAWVEQMRNAQPGLLARPWDPDRPFTTPDGLAAPSRALDALTAAARRVADRHGTLDVPWGVVHRLRLADRDLPANGGSGLFGIFRVVEYAEAADGRRVAIAGDSFVLALELSDPPRARALIGYGNASQPGSPHRGDQLELFAAKRLRPVWRQRAEIEAHLVRRETF